MPTFVGMTAGGRRAGDSFGRLVSGAGFLLLMLWLPALAEGPTQVTVRSGNHPDFGRVVFDAPVHAIYRVMRDGDHVAVHFDGDMMLTGTPPLPRNVLSLHVQGAEADLTVASGSTLHNMRVGEHVVVDVFDPKLTATGPPARPIASRPPVSLTGRLPVVAKSTPAPSPRPPRAVTPLPTADPVQSAPPVDVPAPAGEARVPILFAAQSQRPADAGGATGTSIGPVALVAQTAPPTGAAGSAATDAAFVVPFAPTTGAAAFRRGSDILVVFDEQRPVDLAGLRGDPVLGAAKVDLLQAGTLIRIPVPVGLTLALSKVPAGWSIAISAKADPTTAITPIVADGRVRLPVTQPGQVVTLTDPLTGGTLLVGTQRAPGQSVVIRRQAPQFALLRTIQGVAVEPFADTPVLRVVPGGFALSADPGVLAVSSGVSGAAEDAAVLTRRFEFPDASTEALAARMQREIDAAAATPALARGPVRRSVATTMIALGMDAEAVGVLHVAMADDPQQANSPTTIGLAAIAAMLAGRPKDAAGINDPRLSGSDDVTLWRAVRLAMQDDRSARAAAGLAATGPLILAYPSGIRNLILPLALETMVHGGELHPAAALLAQSKGDPGLDLARAMLLRADGNTKAALALFDTVANGRDQRDAARAVMDGIELRLATGRFNAHQAADALDRRLYAWRGGWRELAWRERLAELRQQSGEWRAALDTLREAQAVFPDDKAALQTRLQSMFDALLHDKAVDKMPSLELVALMNENADLLPATPDGEAMEARLADRLLDLDLPQQAGPVLAKLMQSAPTAVGRAGFGARLAVLRLREGDAVGALAALAASNAPDLPAALIQQRTLVFADASARHGEIGAAVAALTGLGSPVADEARARILEQAKDWPAADRAIADYVAKTVPDTGDLNEMQRQVLLRYATDAARAGDTATLAALREHQDSRMGTGPLADMFRLLTADAIRGTADLQRAGQEVGLVRSLPGDLKLVQPIGPTP